MAGIDLGWVTVHAVVIGHKQIPPKSLLGQMSNQFGDCGIKSYVLFPVVICVHEL